MSVNEWPNTHFNCGCMPVDLSSEPRWYAPKSDKVDAMALFMQGMLGKEEGKRLTKEQMKKQRVVDNAIVKWTKIGDLMREALEGLGADCSFCDHFARCNTCPIGLAADKKEKSGCADYFDIEGSLQESIKLADGLLAVVEAEQIERCPECGQEIEE